MYYLYIYKPISVRRYIIYIYIGLKYLYNNNKININKINLFCIIYFIIIPIVWVYGWSTLDGVDDYDNDGDDDDGNSEVNE